MTALDPHPTPTRRPTPPHRRPTPYAAPAGRCSAPPPALLGLVATLITDVHPMAWAARTATPDIVDDLSRGTAHASVALGFLAVVGLLVLAASWRRHVEARAAHSTAARVVTHGLLAGAGALALGYGYKGMLAIYLPGGINAEAFDREALYMMYVLNDFGSFIGWFGVTWPPGRSPGCRCASDWSAAGSGCSACCRSPPSGPADSPPACPASPGWSPRCGWCRVHRPLPRPQPGHPLSRGGGAAWGGGFVARARGPSHLNHRGDGGGLGWWFRGSGPGGPRTSTTGVRGRPGVVVSWLGPGGPRTSTTVRARPGVVVRTSVVSRWRGECRGLASLAPRTTGSARTSTTGSARTSTTVVASVVEVRGRRPEPRSPGPPGPGRRRAAGSGA